MKIAIIGTLERPIVENAKGGTEVWTYNFVEALVERGLDVTLFARSESKTLANLISICEEKDVYSKDSVFFREGFSLQSVKQAVEVVKKQDDFDIIHFSVFPFYYYLPLTKMITKPTIFTFHGYNRFYMADSAETFIKEYKDPNYVFVSNSFAKNWPHPEKRTVIPNGVKLDSFVFNDKPGEYYFWMGRVCESKGILDAIEFAKRSGEKLVLAGPIDDQSFFKEMIEPNTGENISYIGTLDNRQKVKYYSEAKAFLFPIKQIEPFPLTVLESLACGTPVLSYRRDPMEDTIVDGYNGYLAQSDSIDELVELSKKVSDIDRHNCRKTVEEKFDFNKMTDDYLTLYKEVLLKNAS